MQVVLRNIALVVQSNISACGRSHTPMRMKLTKKRSDVGTMSHESTAIVANVSWPNGRTESGPVRGATFCTMAIRQARPTALALGS